MKILSLSLALLVAACSHFGGRSPSNATTKPRHIVITVHGLSGNEKTFGFFNEATKKYLTQLNPNYDVEVVNFIYPTGRSEKYGSADFALGPNGLGEFIRKQFENQPLGPKDKISFVTHSQGGIVTYIWFFNSLMKKNENFEFAKHVDSIITLGTPFWGSKLASILTDKRNLDALGLLTAIDTEDFHISRHEVADLAYGSDAIQTFRDMAIALDNDPSMAQEIDSLPIRMINITGILPPEEKDLYSSESKNGALISKLNRKIIEKIYALVGKTPFSDRKGHVESDIAVPLPSSRWNFIYTLPKTISEDTLISSGDYQDFTHLKSRSKFLFTESVHVPFASENTLSMAYINKSCLEVETCVHPTYRYIIEQLANCTEKSDCNPEAYQNIIYKMKHVVNAEQHQEFRGLQNTLRSFAIQFDLKLNPGEIDKFPVRYFKRKTVGEQINPDVKEWEFNEYSIEGKVLDLKTNKKTQESIASNGDYKITLADKDERHSIDIVSRYANKEDPFDRLRISISGYVQDKNEVYGKTYVAPIEIKLPGHPIVKIDTLVQPTYSTFTELDYTK